MVGELTLGHIGELRKLRMQCKAIHSWWLHYYLTSCHTAAAAFLLCTTAVLSMLGFDQLSKHCLNLALAAAHLPLDLLYYTLLERC